MSNTPTGTAPPVSAPTAEDLARDPAADLALCDAATPGPWLGEEHVHGGIHPERWLYVMGGPGGRDAVCWVVRLPHPHEDPLAEQPRRDRAMIAAARTALPAWIRRAAAAEAYQADAADRFAAVVRQRDAAEAEARGL